MSAQGWGQACACPAVEKNAPTSLGPDTCAVIVAGGVGSRFGDPRGKQYVKLCGLPLLAWAVLALDRAPSVGHIVVVCAPDRADSVRDDVLDGLTLRNKVTLADCGATRQQSVLSGLSAVPARFEYVAVHDAARPLVTPESVELVIGRLRQDPELGGAIAAARVTDTLKVAEGATIVSTPDRSYYWSALTPQVFRRADLLQIHRDAQAEGYVGTDDASLVEHAGGRVECVETPRDNIKVTLPEDLVVAEALMARRIHGVAGDATGRDAL